MPVAHSERRVGIALVVAAAVAWSTAPFFTRLLPFDPWTILFWRGLFGAATAAAFVLVYARAGIAREFRAIGRPGLLYAGISSLGMIAFVVSLKLTTVAHVAIIYATVPFFAAGLAWLALGEAVRRATLLASGAAFCGVALTAIAGAGEGAVSGDVLAFAMTLLMAGMIVVARHSRGIPMIPAACLAAMLTALASLPFATLWPIGAREMGLLALFGATNVGLGLILFTLGSQLIPAAESALIGSLEAPLAPLWVWLAFAETPRPSTLAGGALVLAAVLAHILLSARAAPVVRRSASAPCPRPPPSLPANPPA